MTSSVAGLVGFVGYSAYSPTKSALRGIFFEESRISPNGFIVGFAEALRSEMILYRIGVHIYFPGTLDTPGLASEVFALQQRV